MKTNQKGFSGAAVIVILAVVGLVSFAGWYALMAAENKDSGAKKTNDSNTAKTNTNDAPANTTGDTASDKKSLSIANSLVSFKVPNSWTNSDVGCVKDSPLYGAQEYIDSTAILPGEKLPTIYGSGTEFFRINVCVFANKKSLTPKEWLEDASKGGIGLGTGGPEDESVASTINGYSAFYRKTTSGYEEISYVLTSNDKVVLVNARTYETNKDLPGLGDFRKFESSIKDLVTSITIQ